MNKIMLLTYDRVAGIYVLNDVVALASNEEDAKKRLTLALMGVKDEYLFKVQDYELYQIGVLDVDKGIITNYDKPVFICSYLEVLNDVKRIRKSTKPNDSEEEKE